MPFMLEMEEYMAYWNVVPPDALIAKGEFKQPDGSAEAAEEYPGYSFEEIDGRKIRRLELAFVQEPARRVHDTASKKITVGGAITRRRDCLNGGRYRNWGIVSNFRFKELKQNGVNRGEDIGLNEHDEGVGECVQEPPDWESLARVNAGWQEPTIVSIADLALLKL